MHELDDRTLLRQYAEQNSEAAFAALVARHVDKVYSVALRHTRNAHAAEEITQAVFVILAKRSGRLGGKVILAGWLYETARLTAVTYIRSEIRRARREQEAYMQNVLNENNEEAWPHIAPLLDDALTKLNKTDRYAIVLRYFDGKSLGEVGAALGASEEAAKKRVTRAVEKLHGFFTKRGVTLTATVLTAAISANSVQAAPLGLAATVTAAAAKGAAVSGSTLALIKGALKIMAWTKAKTAMAVGVGVLLAVGTTTVLVDKIKPSSVDESLWEMKLENLKKAPPVLIIRPTRFSDHTGMTDLEKVIDRNLDFKGLFQVAYANTNSEGDVYSFSRERIILPPDAPQGGYDLMFTLPNHPMEKLQKAIARTTGFAARKETRQTDVLLLKVKDPVLLALHVSKKGSKVSYKHDDNSRATSNFPISDTAQFLEGFFHKPILVQPDFSQHYDFTLRWPDDPQQRGQALTRQLDQMGLELLPSSEPIEMLVIEKVK